MKEKRTVIEQLTVAVSLASMRVTNGGTRGQNLRCVLIDKKGKLILCAGN